MQVVKASEFKAKRLALMDEAAGAGEWAPIAENGKPAAELRPHVGQPRQSPFGRWTGMIEIKGDIISPIDVEWEALE